MGKIYHIQYNFNAGEWSPIMQGRVDLQKYPNALYRLENFILDPRGAAVFRPGWRYIIGTKHNDKASSLIGFICSVTAAYMIELGDYYIRFYKDKEQIQNAYSAWVTATEYVIGDLVTQGGNYYRCCEAHTSGVFATDLAALYWEASGGATDLAYEIPSPYAAADVKYIKYHQSVDVLYLWHPDYATRKLSRASDTSWTLNTIRWNPAPLEEQGIKPATTLTLADVTGASVVFTAGSGVFLSGDVGRIITSGVGRASIIAYNSATEVTCEILDDFTSVGPIASQDWTMQGSPVGTLTPSIKDPIGAICTLTGSGGSESYANLLDHDDPPNDNWLASGSGTDEYYLSNAAAFYSATEPDKVYENGVEIVKSSVGTLGISQWAWGDNDTLGYNTIYVRLSDGADPDSKSTAVAPDDDYLKRAAVSATTDLWRSSDVGKYVDIQNGLIKITGYTSATVVSGEIIKELEDVTATALWTVKDEVWNDDNGWPSCGTFYEDRLCAAGSTKYPETIWGSVTGDYENFTPGADDSDAISFTISGREVSIIRWLEPDEYLLAGSVSKISRLGPEDSGAVLTPTNVVAKRQSSDGVANILPVPAGNAILYIIRTGFDDSEGLKVGEIAWSWESEKYITPDISILAEHMLKPGIIGMAYQKEPNSILWCYRSDGEAVALTYLREHDVIGWHRHPTDGEIESMACIPGDGYYELWAIIKRTINGSEVRYVEMMEKLFDDPKATFESNKGLNAFFVDCGITYNGTATKTITGLDHLEGETVVGLADGSYVSPKVVESGQITLSKSSTVVHIGLPYTGYIQTMKPEIQLKDGTMQGRKKTVTGGNIRVYESGPFKVGVNENSLDDVFDPERVITLGGAYPLFTGDIPYSLDDTFNADNQIMIVQDKPMPLTVLAIMKEIALS